MPIERLKRAMAVHGVTDACAGCGIPPTWRGRPLPPEVDHLDGDWRNNLLADLRLLCPNCHAVPRTWCRGGDPGGRGTGRRPAGP